MDMPVKSKVEEISLRPHEFLLPIFEVVVNAIISVGERHENGGGLINIEISRESTLDSNKSDGLFKAAEFADKEGNVPPTAIKSIVIRDNGVGFDDTNFKSFNTAYSETHKERGCKGVGRFTVLACFNQMQIKSVFKQDGKQFLRDFLFDVESEVSPKDGNVQELDDKEKQETVITLLHYNQNFKQRSAVHPRTIAEAIIEHCLPFFAAKNAPTIILTDEHENARIILNDIFREVIKIDGEPISFKVTESDPPFKLLIVKKYDAKNRVHRLRLCAHSRVVGKSINLSNLINGFDSPLGDQEGKDYFIDAYLTSILLDSRVNTIRNRFHIPESADEGETFNEITLNKIEKSVVDTLTKKYQANIDVIIDNHIDRIKRYITNPKKPRLRYRSLLNEIDLLRDIPTNISEETLEEHLHKIKFNLEKDITKRLKRALKKVKPEEYQEYSETIKKIIDQEARLSKDNLADMLIRRKAILALFDRLLKYKKDDKFHLEEDVHNLIFPMGETSDTIPYEYHNLWLLDERLAFHSFISSDKQIRTNPYLDSSSQKEPDILFFDFPWAFRDKENKMTSAVVFEFKRPGRDMNTTEDRKLDSQILEYFEKLMESKARDYQGELVNLEKTTPKFGYIVCDLHKDLTDYNVDFNGFRKTPFETLYKLNDGINLHIEALSYRQLIEMSEQRHQAFFKELGIEDI